MAHPLTKVERLDRAADGLSTHGSSVLTFLLLILFPSALVWERLFRSPWVGFACAGVAAAAALLCWRRHRFGLLALAAVELAMAGLVVWYNCAGPCPPTFHVFSLLFAVLLAWIAATDLKRGMRFAQVRGREWRSEREQVEKWLAALRGSEGYQRVTEIRERTFARGDRSYRFLDAGDFWVMAMFQAGHEKQRPITYHVREHDAILLEEKPGGLVTARVDGVLLPRGRAKYTHPWQQPLAPKEM